MNYLVTLYANNLLLIFLASAAGYLFAKFLKVGPRPISQVTFYILYYSRLNGQYLALGLANGLRLVAAPLLAL